MIRHTSHNQSRRMHILQYRRQISMSPLSESFIGKERVSVLGREDQVRKNVGQGLRHTLYNIANNLLLSRAFSADLGSFFRT